MERCCDALSRIHEQCQRDKAGVHGHGAGELAAHTGSHDLFQCFFGNSVYVRHLGGLRPFRHSMSCKNTYAIPNMHDLVCHLELLWIQLALILDAARLDFELTGVFATTAVEG